MIQEPEPDVFQSVGVVPVSAVRIRAESKTWRQCGFRQVDHNLGQHYSPFSSNTSHLV